MEIVRELNAFHFCFKLCYIEWKFVDLKSTNYFEINLSEMNCEMKTRFKIFSNVIHFKKYFFLLLKIGY